MDADFEAERHKLLREVGELPRIGFRLLIRVNW